MSASVCACMCASAKARSLYLTVCVNNTALGRCEEGHLMPIRKVLWGTVQFCNSTRLSNKQTVIDLCLKASEGGGAAAQKLKREGGYNLF